MSLILLNGCTDTVKSNKASIDETYQTTWTAAEDKTAEAGEEFALTIGKDQLTFISADPGSDKTAYVTMDYSIVEYVDQVYHLTLSNPTGRLVGLAEKDTANINPGIDPSTIADSLWQSYQDMYINVADGSTIYIYPAGYESSPIALFQK